MDATTVMLLNVKITGKLRDTETVMRSLEGGCWKSTNIGNSLAAYPTGTYGSNTEVRGIIPVIDSTSQCIQLKKPF